MKNKKKGNKVKCPERPLHYMNGDKCECGEISYLKDKEAKG